MKSQNYSNKIYVGNIPGSTTKDEITKLFEEEGKILEIDIKYNRNCNGTNYAFIEYENYKSAEKSIINKNGKILKGCTLKVEYSIDKKNKEFNDSDRSKYRVVVRNFPETSNWKSLKDFLSQAGKVVYAHLESDIGIGEYEDKESMMKAINTLDRTMFNTKKKMYIRVVKDIPYDDIIIDENNMNHYYKNKNNENFYKINFYSNKLQNVNN